MTREEIVAYARRDWAAVAAAKAEFWREEKRRVPAEAIFRRVHLFREQVRRFHPDWPTQADREEDLAHHVELARRLRSAGERPGP